MKCKKITALLLASAMTLGCFTGCGKSSETSTNSTSGTEASAEASTEESTEASTATADAEPVSITLATIKDYYTSALQQVASEYTEKHPNVNVEIQVIGSNDAYSQNFVTKISTDKSLAPDIIHVNLIRDNPFGDMLAKGWILPLDDLLEEENPYNDNKKVRDAFTDEFFLAQAVGSNGQTGYLPFDRCGVAFFYNKDIFQEVGIEVPETYAELDAALTKLEEAGYKNPLGSTSHLSFVLNGLVDLGFRKMEQDFLSLPGDAIYDEASMSQNLEIEYSEDNPTFDSKAIFNTEKILKYIDENGIDSDTTKTIWETAKSILRHCAAGWTSADDGQTINQFIAQKVPVMITGSWNVGVLVQDVEQLSDENKFEWGTFQFPSLGEEYPEFASDSRSIYTAGHKLGITNKEDAAQEEAAKDFLKYLYSPATASEVYKITLEKGELVQGPSLIEGVELTDEINAYLAGFDSQGAMNGTLGSFIGNCTSADQAVMDSLKTDYIDGKISYDEFIAQVGDLTKTYIEDQKKINGYDLDPTT